MTFRWAAAGIILLLIVLLLVGLLIFISADRLAGYETERPPTPTPSGKLRDEKNKSKNEVTTTEDKGTTLGFVISSVTTRIAAALMLILLVSILSNLLPLRHETCRV